MLKAKRFWGRAGVVLGALGLALLGLAGGTAHAAVPQGGAGPLIMFSGPIYPGLDNGFAFSPVGAPTTVTLRGMNQAPYNWHVGGTADVWVYPLHSHTAADHTCAAAPGVVHIGATGALDGTGRAETPTFNLPLAFTQAAGPEYGACVSQAGTTTPYAFSTDVDLDNGRISVYNNAPPTLSVSPATVHPGGTVTVTGDHWGYIRPAISETNIQLAIGHCNSGFSLGSATESTDGEHFSFVFTIPASATPQTGVQACGASGYQHIDNNPNSNGAPPTFDIVAASVATPVPPSATPTPSSAATPVPTPTPGHKGGGGPCGSGMVMMLSFCGGIFWLARRRGSAAPRQPER